MIASRKVSASPSAGPHPAGFQEHPMSPFEAVRLKRSGQRPLCFHGTVLAAASTWSANEPLWYDGTVYETDAGAFIVAISVFYKDKDEPDRHCVFACDCIDSVVSALQGYRPDRDVPLPEPDVTLTTPAEILMEAGDAIQAALTQTRSSYETLLGALLPEPAKVHP